MPKGVILKMTSSIQFRVYGESELYAALQPDFEDLEQRIQFLYYKNALDEHHITAEIDSEIVGMVGLQNSPYEENVVWIKFCSVYPPFRNMGIGTSLVEQTVEWAIEREHLLKPSSYTEDGHKYLMPVIERMKDVNPDIWHPKANTQALTI